MGMNDPKILTIWDQEDLHYVAEKVIVDLRFRRYWYHDDGSWAFEGMGKEERSAAMCEADKKWKLFQYEDYLNFPDNPELHEVAFSEALHMPLETIKEKYLKDVLTKARNIMRKGTMVYDYVVPEEVPDSYLDDLLALRWRENLKLWTIQWAHSQEQREEGT